MSVITVFPRKYGGFDVRWVRFPKHIPFHFATAEAGSADLFPADHFTNGLVDFWLPELAHMAAFFIVNDLVGEVLAEPV